MGWLIDFVWWYCYGFVCFVVFYFLLTFMLQGIKLLTIWSLVCLVDCCPVFPIIFGTTVCWYALFLVFWPDLRLLAPSIDWLIGLIDILIDWSTDRSIHWLIGCLPTGYGGSFLRSLLLVLFYSAPCARERCDPCAFLLALRGFVELISGMVRFRSSVLFRPAWG